MRLCLELLFAAVLGFAQPVSGPVAAIDVYGSASVDPARVRALFPYRAGDAFTPKQITIADVPPALRRLIGDNQFSVAPVFIPDLRGWVLYVDVEPAVAPPLAWNPEPARPARLPARILTLYEHAMDRFAGGGIFAGDETAEGYSLSKDPAMRADELKLIDYARGRPAELYRVLGTSSSAKDRFAAAWIAGYAPQDDAQLAALLRAVTDPDSTVRNNAIRVLAVLAAHDPAIARRIPPGPFIPMLRSLTWTDRNKAMALLDPVTAARDPKTLEALRAQAGEPLRQMARWTYRGHAVMALTLLGRVAGIPEDRLQKLLESGDTGAILSAAEH